MANNNNPFNIPAGFKPRGAAALIRGKPYTLKQIIQAKSKFAEKSTGKFPLKTIALYEDFKMKFYTFLSRDFDDKEENYIKELNEEIKTSQTVRLVFYGQISSGYEMELLRKDEGKLSIIYVFYY